MCGGAWCVHLDLLPGYYSNHTHTDTRCTVLLYRYEVVVCTVHTLYSSRTLYGCSTRVCVLYGHSTSVCSVYIYVYMSCVYVCAITVIVHTHPISKMRHTVLHFCTTSNFTGIPSVNNNFLYFFKNYMCGMYKIYNMYVCVTSCIYLHHTCLMQRC